MPVSLDGLENAFRQLHQDCLKHARRREALLAQVHEQEHYLQELRAAVLEERNAIDLERRHLKEDKDAFIAFRKQVLRELMEQQHHQQIVCDMHHLEQSLCSHKTSPMETPLRRHSSEGGMPESLQALKEEQAQLVQRIQQQLKHFVQDTMPDKCLTDDDC